MRILLIVIAALIGSWLAYDGLHALKMGDYTTPTSGPYAGQLGPWSKLVSAMGVNPRGTPMKTFHLLVGGAWLIGALVYSVKPSVGWHVLVVASLSTLWYVPLGALLALVELVLLLLPHIKGLR